MNGAGNDFVLIDNRARKVKLSRDQVVRLCDRHRGVGADGVILLVPSVSGKADWAGSSITATAARARCAATARAASRASCRS
jgi:diaminopimelate epimerase